MKPKHHLTPQVEEKGKDAEKKPCIDPDTVLLIESSIGIIFEAFKVTLACLLSLFVPQRCRGDGSTDPVLGIDHECTLEEQVRNLSGFNLLVFIWNFITLGVFVVHYVLVYMRESWMVEYLDEDDEFGDNNLILNDHAALKPYPGIANDLRRVNYRVLISSCVGGVALVVNVIVSGISVFGDYYGGFRTATTYITNVLLIATILKTTLSNAYAGIQHHLALSCIHFEPVSYNTIDKDHVDCCKHPGHISAYTDCGKRRAERGVPPDTPFGPAGAAAAAQAPAQSGDYQKAPPTPASPAKSNGDAAQAAAGDVKLDGAKGVELQAVNVVVPAGQH